MSKKKIKYVIEGEIELDDHIGMASAMEHLGETMQKAQECASAEGQVKVGGQWYPIGDI